MDAKAFSLPVLTLVLAGMDAFNPCAFFVLLFLLSLLVHAKSRTRMAIVGGTFVLFSGLVYFVFMAAWLNVFLIAGELRVITVIAGLLALTVAALNIKDYFWFKEGPSLSIPESAKPGLFKRMRGIVATGSLGPMLASTVLLAIVANSYELLCTAGFPMVYTRVLTLGQLETWQYYAWLAAYNVIYVIPLLAIVIVFVKTMGARKLTESEGRILKLVSGFMMLGFGLLLLFAPQLLTNPLASILVLLVAVAVALVAAKFARPAGLKRWPARPPRYKRPCRPRTANVAAAVERIRGRARRRGLPRGARPTSSRTSSTSAACTTAPTPLVACPASTAEVAAVLAICHELGVGVVPHGGNTSYCGGATPARARRRDRAVAAAAEPHPRGRRRQLLHDRRGRLPARRRAGGRRGRGPLLPAGARLRGQLPDRRQPLDQCRRPQRRALRRGARPRARARGRAGRRPRDRRADRACARTTPATTCATCSSAPRARSA